MKHKEKVLLVLVAALIFALVPVSAVSADPDYGLIKANKRKHIVRNWVYDSAGNISGGVTFACQSVEGFQYSVSVKNLAPHTTYTVRAVSLAEVFVPEAGLVPTSDGGGVTYALGSIATNGEGEGEVSGVVPMPATHPFLPFGLYGFEIKVADPAGDVLSTIPEDPIDFQVFPEWP